VEEQRKTVPHYNEGISLLAKAVYKNSVKTNLLGMLKYRRELIALKQYDLLQVYMNSILFSHYFKF